MMRSSMADYPANVYEVLDDNMKFRAAVLRAVRAFARSKPWRGTLAERWQKFQRLNNALAIAHRIEPPMLVLGGDGEGSSDRSHYEKRRHAIVLRGRLSVVTFLHEFAHALGKDERVACRWSINLFKKCFPASFARCRFDRHMVRSARRAGSEDTDETDRCSDGNQS
jgi:hypothetical protein